VSLIHFPIHFHLFPFISIVHFHSPLSILLLHTFSGLRLLHPCLWTPLHALASMHLMCLSSRPFWTYPMCYCFTVPAVHLSYVSHAELHSLSHVVCSHTPDLCGLLLSHVFASIYFWLSFLFYYLDNCVCYISSSPVFGSTSCCPITQFPCPSIHLPSRVCSFGLTPPS